jgi:hypothetical protein
MKASGSGRTRLAVMAAIGLVLAVALVRRWTAGPAEAFAAPKTLAADVAAASAADARPALRTIDWPLLAQRDPFVSDLVYPPPPIPALPVPVAVSPEQQARDLRDLLLEEARNAIYLQGVIAGDRPLAVINGRAYRVGHVVGGYKIVEIQSSQVILERGGVRLAVRAVSDFVIEGGAQ